MKTYYLHTGEAIKSISSVLLCSVDHIKIWILSRNNNKMKRKKNTFFRFVRTVCCLPSSASVGNWLAVVHAQHMHEVHRLYLFLLLPSSSSSSFCCWKLSIEMHVPCSHRVLVTADFSDCNNVAKFMNRNFDAILMGNWWGMRWGEWNERQWKI